MSTPETNLVLDPSLAAFGSLFQMIFTEGTQARNISEQYSLATAGDSDRINEIINTSVDPELIEAREKLAKLTETKAKIEAAIKNTTESAKAKAKELAPTYGGADPDSLRVEFKAHMDKVRAFETAVKAAGVDDETLAKIYADSGYVPVAGLRGTRKSGSASTSKRYKFTEIIVDGVVAPDATSISHVAKYVGSEVEPIRSALVEAAGTLNINEEKGGQEFTVNVVVGDKTRTIQFNVPAN